MTEQRDADEVVVRGRDLLVFRIGAERFAAPLAAVEEAVDFDGATVQAIPGDNPALHGVFPLRGALVPLYGAERILGVSAAGTDGATGATALLVRVGDTGRAAIAVDDVEDLLTVPVEEVQAAARAGDAEVVVRGVLQREGNIIAIVDLHALVTACRASDGRERQ